MTAALGMESVGEGGHQRVKRSLFTTRGHLRETLLTFGSLFFLVTVMLKTWLKLFSSFRVNTFLYQKLM